MRVAGVADGIAVVDVDGVSEVTKRSAFVETSGCGSVLLA
jgi:hypothetical protein